MPRIVLFGLIIIAGLIAVIVAVVIVAAKKTQGRSTPNPNQTHGENKFCRYCGAQVSIDSAICTKCGANIASVAQPTPIIQQQPSLQSQTYNAGINPVQTQLPMNWFKFLIYFSFFAGAVMNVITAIMYFTGAYYQGFSEFMYSTIPELKTIDTLFGVLNLGVAVFAIIARFQLSRFKKSGPMCVYLLYAANVLIYVLYAIGIMAALNNRLGIVSSALTPNIYTTATMNVVICGCMIFVNYLYFKKRKFLFVN